MVIKVRSVNRLTFNIERPTFNFQEGILPIICFIVSPSSMLVGPVLEWWRAGVLRRPIFSIHYAITPSLQCFNVPSSVSIERWTFNFLFLSFVQRWELDVEC
jgi:hypothetical protein